ncbi:conserved hypothetical protein [Leishmania mexicana MHOM/GT/2001/U1103]|uniref:RING-type E3 ubiquitin transferase n=1 Tax=Leishmania mexicana (strain MHOM/GT/2001/U1103) TaxID=929439 RepID=E9AWH1_LEIMU|nr:conserved hypothetical protein [Leishmania mexicana MHOM/GT/2001/U1103]CBZ27307.1 conserved hypothetical protein [Leishmania mexicana MHOM/GT/2001/U1103]
MPKRGRATSTDASYAAEHGVVEVSDADSPTTQPISVEEMMESQRDPLLEQQLDALEVDEDFRESIRAMTPNTRRDVLNDIIRHQQHTEIEEGLMRGFHVGDFGSAGPLFTFGAGIPPGMHQVHMMGGSQGDTDADDYADMMGDVEEEEEGELHDSDRHAAVEEDEEAETGFTVERPPFLLRGMAMGSIDNAGMPHVQDLGGQSPQQAGAPPSVLDILRLIAGHSTPQARSRGGDGLHHQGRGSGQRTAFEEGMMNLHNLIGVLQQANVMQSMGLDHDIDDMTYEELLELEERIGNVSKGVPPALLDSCMVPLRSTSADAGTCAVCQEELSGTSATAAAAASAAPTATSPSGTDKACVKLLNCPHAFHKPCINQWLTQNKTCPICKVEVLPKPAPSSSSAPS